MIPWLVWAHLLGHVLVPVFHVSWLDHGKRVMSWEDFTEVDCQAKLKLFKPDDAAVCVFEPGIREVS